MTSLSAEESLNYLYSHVAKGVKFGLNNISTVLKELGDPQDKTSSIHIAGTNGKGSTAAFCESILRNAGYRVGLYTSPHLIHFSERIQVNRSPLPEKEMISLISKIKSIVEKFKIPITFFEFGTAMAFLHFSEQKTDINVIEVGMGGRLDATSLCKGDITIITSIAKDHTHYLGEKLEKIAFEKASIIKNGGTVFATKGSKKVNEVIKKISDQKSATLQFLGEDFYVEKATKKTPSMFIDYRNKKTCLNNLELSLLGGFQARNAALALSACLHHAHKNGKDINEQSIRKALRETSWSGRMEVISLRPTIILDTAHNPAAVKELAKSVQELFSYARVILILGVMNDKQADEIFKKLANFADHFILVRPKQERSENPTKLKQISKKYKSSCEIIENIPKAILKAKKYALPDDMICVTGSIFTVGEAKQYFDNEPNFKTNFSPSTNLHLSG
ncbi:MAG: bifunctional folylpolyglutamate synthase/dihydrofolate synthase [Nitrospina sp.]|nr:bifunctional folylpolyglutamate synthase/dihydrofolate synthase [Nitrospina sp.]